LEVYSKEWLCEGVIEDNVSAILKQEVTALAGGWRV
jgi:hypothetical protein